MYGRSERNLHLLVLLCEVEIKTGVYGYRVGALLHAVYDQESVVLIF